MAHRALTLKYRPQVFADLIGQDHVTSVLSRALESGRVAHAFLFTGARGVGKTTSARILAKALNCEKRNAGVLKGSDPCNACTSCTEITSGVSLDVVEIDGASNRGIGDVPRISGRGVHSFIRQLNDIRSGARKGNAVALMKPVAEKLTDEDIGNLAAYMASLGP